MKKGIESVLVYFTFGTSLIVLVGNIYMFSYYNAFQVNIYEYLSLQEIPLFFLPLLLSIVRSLLLLSLLGYFIGHSSYSAYRKRKNKIKSRFSNVKITYLYYRSIVEKIASFFLLGAFFLDVITKTIDRWDVDVSDTITGYMLVGIFILLWFVYFRKHVRLLFNRIVQVLIGFILICFVIAQIAKTDAYFTKHLGLKWRQVDKTYIFAKEEGPKQDTIRTNKYLVYVGRTNSTIFFLRKDSLFQTTLIYKRDKLISPEVNACELSPIPSGYSHW